ncbi:MAG: hypothetical protein ACYCT2_05770 [Thermoplasmataceae archaeon]
MAILSNASTGGAGLDAGNYYSFSGQNIGAFPQNTTWIGFSHAGNGTGFNASIEDGQFGKGVRITTQDNFSMSYLRMALATSLYSMVQLGFSWNDNLSIGFTLVSFPVYYGNSRVGDILINRSQNATVISAQGVKYRLSYEPGMDGYYDIKLFFSSSYGRNFYMEIFRNNSNNIVLPLDIPTGTTYGGNLSIMAGGGISNINIYNITDVSGSSGIFQPVQNGTPMSASSFAIPAAFRPYGTQGQAILFPSQNSAYYIGWNSDIIKYNYENGSFSQISLTGANSSFKPVGMNSWLDTVYVLMSGPSSLTIFSLNMTSGSQENFTLHGLQDPVGLLTPGGDELAAYNSSGSISTINVSTGNSPGVISAWPTGTAYRMAGIYAGTGFIMVEGVNLTSGSAVTERIDPVSLAKVMVSENSYSRFDGSIGIYMTGTDSEGYSSIMSSTLSGESYFTIAGGSNEFLQQNISGIACSGSSPVIFNGSSYVVIGNSSRESLPIPDITAPTLWINGNFSAGSEMNATELVIFYHDQADVFSGKNVSLKISSHYFLKGLAHVNTTVTSAVGYNVEISIGNFRFVSDNEDLIINSTAIPDGNYSMSVYVSNSDGYNSTATASCTVDNNNPAVISTPDNGSSVYVGQAIGVEVSNISGFLKAEISSPSVNETTYFTGIHINVTATPGMKRFPIYFNVTDIYGEVFSRYLTFTILNTSYSDFGTNLYNGEFFSHGNVTLTWTPIRNVSSYGLRVQGRNYLTNVSVEGTNYSMQVGNGNFTLFIYPILGDGSVLTEFEFNFTVISYSPGVAVSCSNRSGYSFFGNSLNNSVFIALNSNITSEIRANFTSPSGTVFDRLNGSSRLQVLIGRDSPGFEDNGIYTFSYLSVSESGTRTAGSIRIAVNNTIPVIGNPPGKSLFINVSSLHIKPVFPGNSRMLYSLSTGPFQENYTELENGTVGLGQPPGVYRVSLMDITRSGNFAFYNFTVLYSDAEPVISVNVSGTQARFVNYTTVSYEVSDPAPLKSIELVLGNHVIAVSNPARNGSFLVFFNSDGVYNLSVAAEDLCLNSNRSTNVTVNVTYYVTVSSAFITSSIFGNSGKFSIDMTGTNLQNVNISWYLDGKYAGSGKSLSADLPLGNSNVTCVFGYDGKTFEISRENFVVGFDPFYAVLLFIMGISGSRYALSRKKDGAARELILSSSGKSLSEIKALGRENRVPGVTIRRQVRKLSGSGEIMIERDLNREIYVFASGEGK